MTTRDNRLRAENLNNRGLDRALELLSIRLKQNGAKPVEIVVCGGSALILTGLVPRVTKDVDVLALSKDGHLLSPDPLPESIVRAAKEVAEDLGLIHNWLNNGPSRGEGGLFQMGLPEGCEERLLSRAFGDHLTVHFIDRYDQVYFKLYAAVDRGGYHVEDLLALSPDLDEIEAAARWAMTHDVSEGFALILKEMLRSLGYETVANRL